MITKEKHSKKNVTKILDSSNSKLIFKFLIKVKNFI